MAVVGFDALAAGSLRTTASWDVRSNARRDPYVPQMHIAFTLKMEVQTKCVQLSRKCSGEFICAIFEIEN
jgi:hypothetical protein